MQIVIDIDKDQYEMVKQYRGSYDFGYAIANGIVLPENHGRLIDADVFETSLMNARSYYLGEKADDFDLRFAAGLKSAVERLVDEPTIIEGTKGKGMTVAELIEKLKEVPQDLPVMAAGETAQKVIVEECEGNKYVRIFEPWNIELTGRFVEEGKE